jgi:hypothetical protein
VLAIDPAVAGTAADIWLLDRDSGNLVIRRIEVAPAASASGAASEIALRAVELVRGTLLDIPVEGDAAVVEIESLPVPAGAEPRSFLAGAAVGAAATALGPFSGGGAAYAPALRLSYGSPARAARGLRGRLAGRLTALGLGSASSARARDGALVLGTASIRQELLLAEVLAVFRRQARWQPFASAGLGLHRARVQGSGLSPLFPDGSGTRSALALAAGGGLALRLGVRAAALAEAQLLATTPTTRVLVADQEAARVGRPTALLSLGFLVSL